MATDNLISPVTKDALCFAIPTDYVPVRIEHEDGHNPSTIQPIDGSAPRPIAVLFRCGAVLHRQAIPWLFSLLLVLSVVLL